MSTKLTDFVGGFYGGLRTNRYVVNASVDGYLGNDIPFHVRATSMPSVTTTPLSIPHRGRVYKMPGQRTYSSWSMTILDDTGTDNNQKLWKIFNTWANDIMTHVTNVSYNDAGDFDFTGIMGTFTIRQLNMNGNTVKYVTIDGAWPSKVGQIRMSQDDQESLASFDVILEYQQISDYGPKNVNASEV